MKKITVIKFVAYDGAQFANEKNCAEYENLCFAVDAIMSRFPPRPDTKDCSFDNGEGSIQHEASTFNAVRLALLNLVQKHIKSNWVQLSIEDPTMHPSWVGRLLDEDREVEPLRKAWLRISCIDKMYREWGQGYYAEHPEKGTFIQLNTL